MENFLAELSTKLNSKGFKVSDTFWGSDDQIFNNPPMVIFTTDNENDRKSGILNLDEILNVFYGEQDTTENKLMITPIDGSGTMDSPRYGFILHSGKMDDLESISTPLETQIENYREELKRFNDFLN